jgi:hypothetical protein
MCLEDFDALVKLFGDVVVPSFALSSLGCNEAIYPEMMGATGIRVLAGSNNDSIMNTYGISEGTLYHAGNKFLNAVLNYDVLYIILPTKASE